jgi:hypothetical protein
MMKVRVRLHGTLGRLSQIMSLDKGMEVEIPEGGTVRDCSQYWKSRKMRPVVVLEGTGTEGGRRMCVGSSCPFSSPFTAGDDLLRRSSSTILKGGHRDVR